MNTQDLNRHRQSHLVQPQAVVSAPTHPLKAAILIFFGSMIVGLIPIVYSSMIGQTQTQAPTTLGEAGLWETLGESR